MTRVDGRNGGIRCTRNKGLESLHPVHAVVTADPGKVEVV
jgi:hypothetical protein